MTLTLEEAISSLARLNGYDPPLSHDQYPLHTETPQKIPCLNYHQLNELLLSLGYNRLSPHFFRWFARSASPPIEDSAILADLVERFRKAAMLLYGNIQFGLKRLNSLSPEQLTAEVRPICPRSKGEFALRTAKPTHKIIKIPAADTYFNGYLIEQQLTKHLACDPQNQALQAKEQRMKAVQHQGRLNHNTYLCFDHMDVYVATSMRERHEFYMVHRFCEKLFRHTDLQPLKLRYYDPTQDYCPDRIDKGLVEALMLKRAKCTIYHAQDADTFGKDSELAITLAQGKPVICYVPKLENEEAFVRDALGLSKLLYPEQDDRAVAVSMLRRYAPMAIYDDAEVLGWIADKRLMDVPRALALAFKCAQELYDKRADTLKAVHPLGLQVNLNNGVANGVLVARKLEECARLVKEVMLGVLRLRLEPEKDKAGREVLVLREESTNSVFRYVSGDALLTNTFWNFYLKGEDDRVEPPLLHGDRDWEQLELSLDSAEMGG